MLRVSSNRPCMVCGCDSWCMYSEDEEVAICMRKKSGRPKDCGDAGVGWLHILNGKARAPKKVKAKQDEPTPDFSDFLESHMAGREDILALAEKWQIPESFLEEWTIGVTELGWLLPEKVLGGRITALKVRHKKGNRTSYIKGSVPGLYLRCHSLGMGRVVCPEGFSDTAVLGSRISAVAGRPSAYGCRSYLRILGESRPVRIVAEWDQKPDGRWPGLEGALSCAAFDSKYEVDILIPEEGYKDVRDLWIKTGSIDKMEVWSLEKARSKLEGFRKRWKQ